MKNKVKSNFQEFLDNFYKVIKKPEMRILPGQLAFFFVLAIVPTITLISYGASLLNLSTDIIYNFLSNAFSKELADLLLNSASISKGGFSLTMAIIFGYYIASNGADSIIITTNAIYEEKRNHFLKRRIKAIIMTFFLVLLFIFMITVPIFGKNIVELLQYVDLNYNFREKVARIIDFLQGPITWFIIYIFIKLIYTLAPNKQVKSKNVGYGAAFTSIGWILATYLFSFYITNYANYQAFYGGLANIVILMLWLYALAYIFTIGIALNYRREEQSSK